MAAQQKVLQGPPSPSDGQIPKESLEYEEVNPSAGPPANDAKDETYENIDYPPPWKWEKFFIGGYNQSRMFKFKTPKTMYTAINLFAGVAIMFYGYDQGVMSQVNLNEDYWNHSMDAPTPRGKTANVGTVGINSPMGNSRNVAVEGGIVAVYYGGTLIGALIAGSLADRAGRIKAVVFGSMWALLGAVLQASAQNIAWMCCGTHFSESFSPTVFQFLGRTPCFWSKPPLILLRLISLTRVTRLNQAMLTPEYP